MGLKADLEQLQFLVEQSHSIVSSDPMPSGSQTRAASLLEAANALIDIMVEYTPRKSARQRRLEHLAKLGFRKDNPAPVR